MPCAIGQADELSSQRHSANGPSLQNLAFRAQEIAMPSIVTVVFDRHREYELIAHATLPHEEANRWLENQWAALECEPSHPMGKVLLLDRILGIAKYAGEKRFITPDAWTQQYADAVASALGRPAVRIDVAENVVG
jgi:hypothetical protein